MDTQRMEQKFKQLTTKRHRAVGYVQHLERQDISERVYGVGGGIPIE